MVEFILNRLPNFLKVKIWLWAMNQRMDQEPIASIPYDNWFMFESLDKWEEEDLY